MSGFYCAVIACCLMGCGVSELGRQEIHQKLWFMAFFGVMIVCVLEDKRNRRLPRIGGYLLADDLQKNKSTENERNVSVVVGWGWIMTQLMVMNGNRHGNIKRSSLCYTVS